MPHRDWLVLMGMGVLFNLLGLGSILWGKSEEKNYYSAISHRPDVREFLEHWPPRPQPVALKIGGVIATAVGIVLIVIGITIRLRS